jgi:tetratricopeptide (TPR) repeat protein
VPGSRSNGEDLYALGLKAKSIGAEDRAKRLFEQAASRGSLDALRSLAEIAIEEGDRLSAHGIAMRGAYLGHGGCMHTLAFLAHDAGDLHSAKAWYHEAVKAGDRLSLGGLGLLHVADGNLDLARDWFERAAILGDAEALFNVGAIEYVEGRMAKARDIWIKSALVHQRDSYFWLATDSWTCGDTEQARKYFEAGAGLGAWNCMFALGAILWADGMDVQAHEWLGLAAKHDGAIRAFVFESMENPYVFDRWRFCEEVPQFRGHLMNLALDGVPSAIKAFWIAARAAPGDADLVRMQLNRMRGKLDPSSEMETRDHVRFCKDLGDEWVLPQDLERIFRLSLDPEDAIVWYFYAWSSADLAVQIHDQKGLDRVQDYLRSCAVGNIKSRLAKWHRQRGEFEVAKEWLNEK